MNNSGERGAVSPLLWITECITGFINKKDFVRHNLFSNNRP